MDIDMRNFGGWPLILLLVIPSLGAASGDVRLVNAVKQQDTQAVQQLLTDGVDVDGPQPDGATALHWTAHWNDLDTAGLLLRAGANVNAANNKGVTPLALACENGTLAMVEKLLNGGADANAAQANGETALMTAARSGNVDVVRALLAHGGNVNATTNELGQTALMWAIAERNRDVARTLIESGANVRAQSKSGFTALMFAARLGDIEPARILLAAGADVNQTAAEGETYTAQALPLAVASGQLPMALFLLDNDAGPNGTAGGMAALHYAVSASKALGGQKPIDSLAGSQRLELVQALLQYGADPNARRTAIGPLGYGQDPKNGAFDAFTTGVGTRKLATPLFMASDNERANVELVRTLVHAGADPSLTTDDGTTPLMVAAGIGIGTTPPNDEERSRMLALIKFLVEEAGVDVNAGNEAGFTALHGAAYTGSNAIVQYLVEHGARLDAQDFRERTPYRIAQGHQAVTDFHEWPETAELLASLGANTSLGQDGHQEFREGGRARDSREVKGQQEP